MGHSMDANAVAKLKAKVVQDLAEAQKKLEAIAIVERMLAEDASLPNPASPPSHANNADDEPRTAQADSDESAAVSTAIDSVWQCFEPRPEKHWTVAGLETALRSNGFKFVASKPQKTIHTALHRLVKRGLVRIVRKGKGKIPSVYAKADTSSLSQDTSFFAINSSNTKL